MPKVVRSEFPEFPIRTNEFPVLDPRKFIFTAMEMLENPSFESARSIKFRRDSLNFPC